MRYTKTLINKMIANATKKAIMFAIILGTTLWLVILEVPPQRAVAEFANLSMQDSQAMESMLKDESSQYNIEAYKKQKVNPDSFGTFTGNEYKHGDPVTLEEATKNPLTIAFKINSQKIAGAIYNKNKGRPQILEGNFSNKNPEMILPVKSGKLASKTNGANIVLNFAKEFYKGAKKKSYSNNLATEFSKNAQAIVADLEQEVITEEDQARIHLYTDAIVREFFIENKANIEKISDNYQFSLSFSEQIPESVITEISGRLASKFNNLNGKNLTGVHYLRSSQANMLAHIKENNFSDFKDNSTKNFMVVDFGASHLASHAFTLEKKDNKLQARSYQTESTDEIGGNRIDKKLYNHFVKKIKNDEDFKGNKDLPTFLNFDSNNKLSDTQKRQNKDLYRITKALIEAKKKLSADGADDVQLNIDLSGDNEYSTTLTVDEVNELLKGFGKIFKEHIENQIERLKLQKVNIDEVVIAGGSLRIPYFKKILQEVIDKENKSLPEDKKITIVNTLNMDESSAFGASYIDAFKGFREIGGVKTFQQPKVVTNHKIVDNFWTMQEIKQQSSKKRNEVTSQIYDIQRAINDKNNEVSQKLEKIINLADGEKEEYAPHILLQANSSLAENLEKFYKDPKKDYGKLSKYLDDWEKAVQEHLSNKDAHVFIKWENLPTLYKKTDNDKKQSNDDQTKTKLSINDNSKDDIVRKNQDQQPAYMKIYNFFTGFLRTIGNQFMSLMRRLRLAPSSQ